ncbi:MAG: DUF58 domain-containing protein [Bacteroidia bacterium]|nr:DUF58 domain-containing protein [Bacteroidia bacterium]MDW8301794.1 DUF58 domain-containing protein [Bacteroidia bacterium]
MIHLEDVQHLTNIEIIARQIVEGFITGLHKSPYHGFSVEFAEHRLYNTGESTKNIDWKVYGRTEKLFVKKFEEETNLRCQVVLDISRSMRYPKGERNKLRYSAYLAASLMYLLVRQRDAVGLTLFDQEIVFHTYQKSTYTHLRNLFLKIDQALQMSAHEVRTHASAVLHQIAEKIHRRAMVVIISDLFDNVSQGTELFTALKHLKHNKHDVVIFHVLDKKTELDFEFHTGQIIFKDIETGQEIKVQTNQVKEAYRAAIQEYKQKLMYKCGEYQIDFNSIDIAEPFENVLRRFLVKRTKWG